MEGNTIFIPRIGILCYEELFNDRLRLTEYRMLLQLLAHKRLKLETGVEPVLFVRGCSVSSFYNLC
jgi:hypothetical protein